MRCNSQQLSSLLFKVIAFNCTDPDTWDLDLDRLFAPLEGENNKDKLKRLNGLILYKNASDDEKERIKSLNELIDRKNKLFDSNGKKIKLSKSNKETVDTIKKEIRRLKLISNSKLRETNLNKAIFYTNYTPLLSKLNALTKENQLYIDTKIIQNLNDIEATLEKIKHEQNEHKKRSRNSLRTNEPKNKKIKCDKPPNPPQLKHKTKNPEEITATKEDLLALINHCIL